MIDFNGMSTDLGLFYALRLKNRVYIYIFVELFKSLFFCPRSYQIRIMFKQICLANTSDHNGYDQSRLEKIWDWWQWRGTLYSTDLQNKNHTLRYSLVSYSGQPNFFERGIILLLGIQSVTRH